MKKTWMAAVVVAALPHAAFGEFELKGIRLGMTKDELVTAHPGLDCSLVCYYTRGRSKSARSLDTLGGAPVKTWDFKFNSEGKLASGYAILHASSGATITAALTEKFGKPASVEEGEFKTAAGYKGPKVTTTWVEGDNIITFANPSGKIDEMRVEIYSKVQREAEIEAFKARSKKDL